MEFIKPKNKDILQLIWSELTWNSTLDIPSHIPFKLCCSLPHCTLGSQIMRESVWFVKKYFKYVSSYQKHILVGIFNVNKHGILESTE